MTALIISVEEMGDIIKIVKSHEESSLLQNMLAGKEVIRATVGAIAGVGDSSRRRAWRP